jgi:hypothetical protein
MRTDYLEPLLRACSLCLLFLAGCSRDAPSGAEVAQDGAPPPPGAAWLLDGSSDERFVRVARHLRGFDVAMVETGYRYSELVWAGRDENWDYAAYQVEKIETTIGNGLERRPRRAVSARMLDAAMVGVKEAVTRRDRAAFDAALTNLTSTCNACHRAEGVPFVHVEPPAARLSPVTGGDAGGP